MRALVTGFDPFGGGRVNASLEAVRRLPARIGTLDVVTAELPTSYARSIPALKAALKDARPGIVLCVGEAGERSLLSVERVAINVQDARMPDNDGAAPADRPVVRGGPAAYFSTLPVRAMVAALRAAELPAELSMSAGAFVCNHVFYGLMHVAATTKRSFRGGFLHVPCLTQGGETAPRSMPLDDIVRGIVICLETAEESLDGRNAT
jgi:pyroglutamyl-peptidase